MKTMILNLAIDEKMRRTKIKLMTFFDILIDNIALSLILCFGATIILGAATCRAATLLWRVLRRFGLSVINQVL